MSDEIDKRIVEMEFRNKKFQENAEQTIKTLDKLDESLDFNSGVGKSLDVIASKFTNLGVIGQGVLQNLATDAYNLGKNLVKSLTVDQIGSGFGEYQLKMGSIQTIMAGTGESLDVVNKKLSELNDYADRTIYSFSDMTANIGKFTNAGVKLDTAVSAIQGVTNLAAVSGANAEQASHAMYNFAQALSAGYVKLVDWKSIEIANMATVEFKDELIKTALKLGTIRKEGNKYVTTTTDMNGSISDAFDATTAFNDSLSYQWLTTDVLTETLGRYTDETTDLGKKAFKSATELKTFSMMMDALKESAGSGWAETMEIIFGNYDEAIELWTGLFNRIDGWMSNSAKKRNEILTAWKGFGGRDAMIKSLENVLNALEAMTKPISRALDKLLSYNKGWRYLEDQLGTIDIGPVGNAIYQSMVRASKGIEKFTESLIPSEETLESITGICSGFVSVLGIVFDIAKTAVGFIGKIIRVLSPLLKIVLALAGVIGDAIFQITNAVRGALNLGPAARNVSEFFDNMYESVNTFSDKTVAILHNIPGYITRFLETLKNLKLPDFSTIGKAIVDAFSTAISRFKEKKTLKSFFEGLIEPESVKKAAQSIGDTFSGLASTIGGWVDKIKEKILSIGPIGEIVVAVFNMISGAVSKISNGIVNLLSPLLGLTQKVATRTGDILSEIDLASILDIAKIATFVVSMVKIQKALKSVSEVVDGVQETLHNFAGVVKSFGGALKDLGKGVKLAFQAEAFKSIAYSIALVVGAVMLLTTADKDKLQDAISAFLLICAGLVLVIVAISDAGQSVKRIKKVADPFTKLANALNSMAAAFVILSTFVGLITLIMAIKNLIVSLGEMDPEKLNQGLTALKECINQVLKIVIAIGVIGAALSLIEKMPTGRSIKALSKLASSLILFAIGITALLAPVAIIAQMDTATLAKGLGGLAKLLGILLLGLGALAVVSRLAPDIGKTLAALSLSLMGFTSMLFGMIGAVFALGKMDSETASNGMIRLAEAVGIMVASILGLALAIKIIGKAGDKLAKISLGFAALAGAAAIISLFAPTIIANAASIKNAIWILVDVVVSALVDATDRIVAGALLLIVKVLDALIIYLPNILIQLETIFNQILDWLILYTPTFIDKVIKIVGMAINSIAKGMGEYVNPDAFIKSILAIEAVLLIITQMAKLRGQTKKAIPTLAMAMIVIGSVGMIFVALNKLGLPSQRAGEYADAISKTLVKLVPMMFALSLAGKALKDAKVTTMLGLVGSLSLLIAAVGAVFWAMDKLKVNPMNLMDYAEGLAVALSGLAPLVKSMGLVVALMGALHLDAGTIFQSGAALVGVVAIAGAALVAFMALIGGIDELSGGGFQDILKNAVEIFSLMGEAIGTFTGSLFGGIGEGVLITLGKGLGEFAKYSQSFFDMVSGLDATFGEKMGALAGGIMTLAGAGFVNAVSDLLSIFTGDSSLGLLGKELMSFGSDINQLYVTMGDISLEEAQSLKYIAEGVAALSDAAPKVGGLAQVFTGTTDLYAIANNMGAIGEGLVEFQKATAGLDEDSIEKTKKAAEMLSILMNAIPKSDGIVQAWSGEVDYAGFSAALPGLGTAIKGFNDAVTDASGKSTISPESIDVATNAAKMITGVVTNLPATGGLWQRIVGEQDMDKFVANLPALANGIVAFDKVIKANGGIDANSTTVATRVAETAANIFAKLPTTGGWAGTLGGEKDLKGFSDNLGPLGDGVRNFYLAVTKDGVKIDAETAKLATYVAESAANIQEKLTKNTDFNGWATSFPNLKTFGDNLKPLGEGIHNFTVAIAGTDYTYVPDAMSTLNAIADLQNTLDYGTIDYMLTAFEGDETTKLSLFAGNLSTLGAGVMAFSNSVAGINVQNVKAATEAINMLVNVADLRKKIGEISLGAFNDAIGNLSLDTFGKNVDEMLGANKELVELRDKFIAIGKILYDSMMDGFSVGWGSSSDPETTTENRHSIWRMVRDFNDKLLFEFEDQIGPEAKGDLHTRLYGVGKNIILGINNGMLDVYARTTVKDTARKLMINILETMEDTAEIESPSKKTAEDGRYLLLGLAKGMKDNTGVATNSATVVTDEVMATLQNGMSTISKRLQDPDFDMSPTITPVVDMSNVRLSVQEADDLFNSKRLSLNANVGSASLEMARSVKMEVSSVSNGDISRAKMLEMMSKIGQKLDDMENKLGGMSMVLDTGELVGAITPSMMRSMDKRKVKIARGVVAGRSR